jgi:hypothetical protein
VFATSASILMVALAFTLYAVAEPYVGRAGAAACVAGAAALILAIGALILTLMGRDRKPKSPLAAGGKPLDRIIAFLREKPVLSISAAIGAGLLAVRNPQYLGSALRAFIEGREVRRRR